MRFEKMYQNPCSRWNLENGIQGIFGYRKMAQYRWRPFNAASASDISRCHSVARYYFIYGLLWRIQQRYIRHPLFNYPPSCPRPASPCNVTSLLFFVREVLLFFCFRQCSNSSEVVSVMGSHGARHCSYLFLVLGIFIFFQNFIGINFGDWFHGFIVVPRTEYLLLLLECLRLNTMGWSCNTYCWLQK